ncbi:phosphatidylglycerol--membrane-oligosaccharide glycerophosphotransferase [Atlantibacter subterranea]|uniref:Phosphatidylglycerol--membrane-oligosaccharide glycerophosphotransferase n=1 Tax=Atlantibacter subterraneus TaxID=255519 RepID=A0A427UUP5_9ENTR|nr:phosphatidylglycerol--membrane-oligosaccharide glycerophosphotransferase [Atlantibacter subterranea]MDA3132008.1 phosphatidylglycerol--membrane-oligosaccharide glycerophosphotransferase [Atlantibacter subterranea]RSB61397.1 phosphatidylglycerol--membrane-oligosaccharide glycerophosphotransferase [Atlantibacter subterranea]RSE07254.1 phosphatidylglycerol--membrane-oligosaccharide glycerophosphotransferase [Atlantibacter subterranea]RSE24213.1 phosphatidylglycerol--membrane-oligosaccharide gly
MSELLSVILFIASIVIYSLKAGRNTWWFAATLVVLGLFVILNITLYASDYFTGDGINDAVIYTLTNSLAGAGVSKYLLPGAGLIAALVLVFGALAWVLRRRRHRPYHFGYSLLALVMALASVDASPAFRQISELVKSQSRDGDPDFVAYYKEPKKVIDNPTLNLVYIYGESLERTYFDDQAFPGLTPELGALKNEGIDFSHTAQLPGTDYTIAGMVASQCGIPLFAPFEGNASASMSSFFPQNICLGDILKNSGYENHFVQGASLRFAGKDVFLKSHGFDHLYGADELKSVVADPHYRNDWGFYDDTVLDQAWQKFEALSKEGKRFSLFTLTVDTHHPDGFVSRSCERKRYDIDGKANQSFSAVTCSQQHIAAFINKIKDSPYFKNTVIVVSSDHLAMNNTGWKYLNQQDRNNLFFVLRGDKPQQEVMAVKRNTMDNGATVLDILGGDNFIGLGRSSLSGDSLSTVFLNMKEKVLAWKPDVIRLWNFPREIKDFTIDQEKQTIAFSGSKFRLPLLLRVSDKRVEPLPESEYSAPLRYQLADFAPRDNFIWIDRCYKMARLWSSQWALSTDWCVSQGQLGGEQKIVHVDKPKWQGKAAFRDRVIDTLRYQGNVDMLKTVDNDIRYKADSFVFNVAGAPEEVKSFSGISRPESWGRWSNAQLDKEVKIEYNQPLPEKFELVITAKAFGPNANQPIPVRVGDSEQTLTLGNDVTTTTLHFDNPSRSNTLVIVPPAPQETNEGNILGHSPRKLGIGMVDIKVVKSEG